MEIVCFNSSNENPVYIYYIETDLRIFIEGQPIRVTNYICIASCICDFLSLKIPYSI